MPQESKNMPEELTTASLFGTQIQHMEPLDRGLNGFDVRPGFLYVFRRHTNPQRREFYSTV